MMRHVHRALWALLCLNLWLFIGYMVFERNVGAEPLLSGSALVTATAMLLAPWVTFLPIATRLGMPLFEYEAAVGWATLMFVVSFIPPDDPVSRGQFLVLLLPLTVAIASLAALVAFAVGRRLSNEPRSAADVVRARREGYFAGIVLVLMLLMQSLGVLSIVNAMLAISAAALAEGLMLTRKKSVEPEQQGQSATVLS